MYLLSLNGIYEEYIVFSNCGRPLKRRYWNYGKTSQRVMQQCGGYIVCFDYYAVRYISLNHYSNIFSKTIIDFLSKSTFFFNPICDNCSWKCMTKIQVIHYG
jgi:hypothetical protein